MYYLERTQIVEAPLEIVFDFFSRPENLRALTPPAMNMRVMTPHPIPMHVGAIIDYVLTVGGLPLRWTTCISEFEARTRFVDVQLRGPYSFWHHTHTFEAQGTGTLIHDRVVYALPLGWIGRVAHRLFVQRQLEDVFAYRRNYMAREDFREELRGAHGDEREAARAPTAEGNL